MCILLASLLPRIENHSKASETPQYSLAKTMDTDQSKSELLTIISTLREEKASAVATLAAERQNRLQLEKVVREINTNEALHKKRVKFDAINPDDFLVTRDEHDVLSKNTTTNTCSFSVKIHDDPKPFLQALITDHTPEGKLLHQKVLEDDDSGIIVYWSFLADKMKASCDLLLRLNIEEDGDEIRIGVISVDEQDLEATLPFDTHPTSTKKLRLFLNDGMIVLRPLEFNQTSFMFTAIAKIGEVKREAASNGSLGFHMSVIGGQRYSNGNGLNIITTAAARASAVRKKKMGINGAESAKVGRLFSKLADLFYDRFKKEVVIDERRKEDFVKKIDSAPTLTEDEKIIILESMKLVEEASTKAKRIAGTVKESVEKFLHKPEGGGAGWAMSVARIDVPAEILLANLWFLDTYENKTYHKDTTICECWNNIDGTRGLQYSLSLWLPGGFNERLFESFITWEKIVDADGRRTLIIAFSPLHTYTGTHYKVEGANNMVEATSKGVYIVKELTENTCEWTRAQQVNLNISLPANMLDFLAKQQLGWANEYQEDYRRNGNEVDREIRVALARKMIERRGSPLMEDQLQVFKRCEELLGGGEAGWEALESTSQSVNMSMKYFPPKKGERSIATGKAVGVVDCSAEKVAAWAYDYCNNERMQVSNEEGNPARIELRAKGEFVFRQFWKSEEGKVVIAIESIDDEIDYGVRLRKTRGFVRAFWQVEDLPVRGGAKQCRATFVQQIDAGGSIPTWVVNKKVPQALSGVQGAIDEFRQDEKVDAASLGELATLIRERGQNEVYSEEENALLERACQTFEDDLKEGALKQLKSPDVFVKMMSTVVKEGDQAVIGKCVAVVDAAIEDCAAFELAKMTRVKMKDHYDFGGVEREEVALTNHSDLFYFVADFGIKSFARREWLMKSVWKMVDENTIIIGYEDAENDNYPIGAGKKYVRASATAFWKFERLPEMNGFPLSRVTYCQKADLKGFIPRFVANLKIVRTLEILSVMRKKFDKSLEIDVGRRAEIVKKIKREVETGGAEGFAQFEAMFEEKRGWERPSRSFGKADSFVKTEILGSHSWGKTTVKIKAEMEEVAAFFWDYGSRAYMEVSRDLERTFEENDEGGGFKKHVHRRQKMDSAYSSYRDRAFASDIALVKVDSETMILLLKPAWSQEESNGARRKSVQAHGSVILPGDVGFARAKETVAIRLRRSSKGRTKLDYACELDLGPGVSFRACKRFVERRLEEIADISVYFQRLMPLGDYGVEEGQALGHDLMWKVESSSKRVEKLKEVVEKSRALRELCLRHSWMKAMLTTALEGSLHMNSAVATKLACVSEVEGMQIGRNLVPSLMTEQLAEAGVNEWRVQNRAVKELMEAHVWFEPMAVVLGKGLVKTAAWGVMSRVMIGAILSVTDLVTDLVVLHQFWSGGDKFSGYRNAQLTSFAVSVLFQLAIVAIQNHKKSFWKILKEVLIVCTGIKAPYDAYKVAMGSEKEENTQFGPMMELTFGKFTEMFAEAIPGIIIQTSAILSTLESGENAVTTTAYTLLCERSNLISTVTCQTVRGVGRHCF
ncbi:hypothetical protein TL16_g07607 [Triparma laevis f. inornata]|uniref:Uncharacterized protein n=1 Tax=Triparma laevis f. inornata TaxID=1714386 RepID=A0A9W7AYU8_9STRA|nr:hypothetical protein TL16_g07607 [Triparma laevis f. inornata]